MARRDIEFDAEGVTLRGWFYPAGGADTTAPTVVMAHGFSAVKEMFTESIPLKRWGEVDDIAYLAVFLASDESTYIHGDLIKVDGGETLSLLGLTCPAGSPATCFTGARA